MVFSSCAFSQADSNVLYIGKNHSHVGLCESLLHRTMTDANCRKVGRDRTVHLFLSGFASNPKIPFPIDTCWHKHNHSNIFLFLRPKNYKMLSLDWQMPDTKFVHMYVETNDKETGFVCRLKCFRILQIFCTVIKIYL